MQTLLTIIIFLLAFIGGAVIIYVITHWTKSKYILLKTDMFLNIFPEAIFNKAIEKINIEHLSKYEEKFYVKRDKLYLPKPTSSNDYDSYIADSVLLITLICFEEQGILEMRHE